MNVEPSNVVAFAKKALSASKQAASLAEDLKLDLDDLLSNNLESANSLLCQLRKKQLRSRRKDVRRKLSQSSDPNDPLQLFLWGPETKQLLTAEEESDLIIQVQVPFINPDFSFQTLELGIVWFMEGLTLVSSSGLKRLVKAELRSRKRSREKLIHANLCMVVHIAKQYQGRGLSLQDLLQEGSIGLMRSVEKFKPQVGCRFATYAYWWIRQMITKSIMQHFRSIHLALITNFVPSNF
ncbi:hypothetical protein V6N12_048973 [Hibiscus sabdariffa]|uniref:RNA polymerase sigma-70 domain-containing protein n=1 Tax=Hibiscus sabdariffa TaxID=183260 RepID=A0ABR2EKC7_9ROSI